MAKAKKKPRPSNDVILGFRIKVPDYARLKLMAAAERRQINAMARELVLRGLEVAHIQHLETRRPTRADREFPSAPDVRE